ncbi:hypothetical protein Pla123a_33180 [Posidoniimonas polymericola]|uniref:Uncharacterized protein n=1 Tax=Posidoniimonas polymericola TaxID=2528002 RepID=A0A5C5YHS8_9BACT|nr:permease prefix domain 1-containing protein [Posidoniimonas polymericola]TWT74495.1 hypothetical protein Pla123a_33180 [Posidoniimonas polymericola]
MIELKRFVERAVRPVRSETMHKLRLREELYAHLQDAYQQECNAGREPEEAQRRSIARMGDPAELTAQMQSTISVRERWAAWVNDRLGRARGESPERGARRVAWAMAWQMTMIEVVLVLMESSCLTHWDARVVVAARLMTALTLGMSVGAYLLTMLSLRFIDRESAEPRPYPSVSTSLLFLASAAAVIFALGAVTHALAAWGPFDLWPATARWLGASAGGSMVALGASLMAAREKRQLEPWLELEIEG